MNLFIASAAVLGAAPLAVHAAEDVLRARYVFRRNFPSPEEFSWMSAPLCPKTGAILETKGVMMATSCTIRVDPDDVGGRTLVTEVRQLRGVADWVMEHTASYYHHKNDWIPGYKQSTLYQDVSNGLASYVVVSLSNIARGPPLLPQETGEGASGEGVTFDSVWEPTGLFSNCPEYLQSFFRRIGLEVEVHPTLDGQSLVYYQAALWRTDWDRTWAALDKGPWRAHGAAYRRKYGGRHAPRLVICNEPRFTDKLAADAAQPKPGEALQGRSRAATTAPAYEADLLPVVGTFVHFSGPPGLKNTPKRQSNPLA